MDISEIYEMMVLDSSMQYIEAISDHVKCNTFVVTFNKNVGLVLLMNSPHDITILPREGGSLQAVFKGHLVDISGRRQTRLDITDVFAVSIGPVYEEAIGSVNEEAIDDSGEYYT